MTKKSNTTNKVHYSLNHNGCFSIENYNQSKAFSNFFPGIAGLMGIPMWVFYVNRGQCISSFGIESKDKAIMEFQPANKAYRSTSLNGFRTFLKVNNDSKIFCWEPFQEYLVGTDYKKKQKLSITASDLTIEENNLDLHLSVKVNYFTLPQEPYSALVRRVTIKNTGKKPYHIELIDGLPIINPYGAKDALLKNMSRTLEAWVKVHNCENKAPFYHLNVEISDTPQVIHIKEGNFYLSFDPEGVPGTLLEPLIESTSVFGPALDFVTSTLFTEEAFKVKPDQRTSNKSPSAMCYESFSLKPGAKKEIISLFGTISNVDQLNQIVKTITRKSFIDQKSAEHKNIICGIMNHALTHSSSKEYDLYSKQTFLDNVLRGGLPVSIETQEGVDALNVYNRKHGDLERDYNYFVVLPTYYSQGNGNYRDVNQNRRNDIWFNPDVGDHHLVNFMNLTQADGYNPLVMKGTYFVMEENCDITPVLEQCVESEYHAHLKHYMSTPFRPGTLLTHIDREKIILKCEPNEFLGRLVKVCKKEELVDHGEGYWSDHWTYNMDLIESYLRLYPEQLKELLLEKKKFTFYHNSHYILPRNKRYILTERGVRQFQSVLHVDTGSNGNLKTKQGSGAVYQTNLICKLLCLIANKSASLDPSGVGIEMEADKPNWNDSLNGLPGLLGSSINETLELKRFCQFLLESLKQLALKDSESISLFEELATFLAGLSNLLAINSDSLSYWEKSNDIKEHYRQLVRNGIDGKEKEVSIGEVKKFLNKIILKVDASLKCAIDDKGRLATYFYHEVTDYDLVDKRSREKAPHVRPNSFKMHSLPQFLEGYVHVLRLNQSKEEALNWYETVLKTDLYDQKLKMYKVNADLKDQTEEIGRIRIFPSSWLENESVWLHMEYKFLLELLRNELYEEFFENFKNCLVPFLKPETYGRSILENSSFIVSSAHEDEELHGQGFVARLSGSTAEFIHMWLLMNLGAQPFLLNAKDEIVLNLQPALPAWLFTNKESSLAYTTASSEIKKTDLPANSYAFLLFGSLLVVYHNPNRKDTFGENKAEILKINLTYPDSSKPTVIRGPNVEGAPATDVRDRKVERIDVYFE